MIPSVKHFLSLIYFIWTISSLTSPEIKEFKPPNTLVIRHLRYIPQPALQTTLHISLLKRMITTVLAVARQIVTHITFVNYLSSHIKNFSVRDTPVWSMFALNVENKELVLSLLDVTLKIHLRDFWGPNGDLKFHVLQCWYGRVSILTA